MDLKITPKRLDFGDYQKLYKAICSEDTEQLKTLLENWKKENGSEALEDILSRAFMEIKLNIIPISDETERLLEETLLQLRFYSNKSENVVVSDIKDRISLINESINSLHSYVNNDEMLTFVLTFIAKQIFVLKRLLKSTYDRLPWEEIEFCLVSFVRCFKERNALNIFYRSTLNKQNIMSYLVLFSAELTQVQLDLCKNKITELSKIPNLKREIVIQMITDNYPEFENLYNDHEHIRDIHSLSKISEYAELVSSIDPRERIGQLVIIRALQMIGEHLKNTLESPKLSKTTSNLILLSLHKSTRDVIIYLRNSLSHSFSMSKRIELGENKDVTFFEGTQNDVKKIGRVIANILFKYRIQLLRELSRKFIDSEDIETMKEVAVVFDDLSLFEMTKALSSELEISEVNKLKKLISELDNYIEERTYLSSFLFKEIHSMLQFKQVSTYPTFVYIKACVSLFFLSDKIQTQIENSDCNQTNAISTLKYLVKNFQVSLPPQMETLKLSEIVEMLIIIESEVRSKNQNDDNISRLVSEIIHIAKFEIDRATWAEKFKRKLNQKYSKFDKCPRNQNIHQKLSHSDQLASKLSELKIMLGKTSEQNTLTFSAFKKNKGLQAAVEVIVLDIFSILASFEKPSLENKVFFFDSGSPSLIGKNLRNHLAHNNVMIEVFLNPVLSVYLNACKLINEGMTCRKQNIGKIKKYSYSDLKSQYEMNILIINRKQKMLSTLKEGNFTCFLNCIEDGADIQARDIYMSTSLHCASNHSSVQTVKYLCSKGVNPRSINAGSQTPLHIAAANGNVEVLEYLLQKAGSIANEADNSLKTCLHLAAYHGHELVVQALLKHKVLVDLKDCMCFTPLHYAILSRNKEVVELFFQDNTFKDVNETLGGLTALHVAAENGLLQMVEYLLSKNVNVNSKSDIGGTALHVAAFNGHLEVVKALIREGADVNTRSVNGCTPLHFAAEKGYESVVKVLLEHGANVDMTDHEGKYTPLHYVTKDGYFTIVQVLLRNKANINAVTSGSFTPLHYAVESGHEEIVAFLLTHDDIKVNIRNFMNFTPLHIAAELGHFEIVNLLMNNGADLNNNSGCESPLHLAAKGGHENVVDLLINHGASISAKTLNGSLPLHAAVQSGNINIIRRLIESGADVNVETSDGSNCLHLSAKNGKDVVALLVHKGLDINSNMEVNGFTALHEAVMKNHLEIVKSLITNGADINSQDKFGDSPLHKATTWGFVEIVETLIEYNADIHIRNKSGDIPIFSAIRGNHEKIVKMLSNAIPDDSFVQCFTMAIFKGNKAIVELFLAVQNNAISRSFENGYTALHMSVILGHVDIVELLLKKGASVDVRARNKETPLILAAQKEWDEILSILVSSGADVNALDEDNSTALHYACKLGNHEMVKNLLNQGAEPDILDKKNRSAIELAAAEGHSRILKLLLKHTRIDINRKGNDGFTLLHIAAQYGHPEIIEYLINEGADCNVKNNLGSKPIHIGAREGFQDIVDIFLKKGMSIDDRGINNNTLLHYAASSGKIQVMRHLLDIGHAINSVNDLGRTPIHIACGVSQEDAVKFLLNAGAIYNLPDILGLTPLQLFAGQEICDMLSAVENLFRSVKSNKITEIEKLLRGGVILNSQHTQKGSALHFAVYKGYEDIIKLLLQNGAMPNLTSKNGWTPLHYAAKYSRTKIVKLLLSFGARYDAVSDTGKTPLDFSINEDIISLLKLLNNCFMSVLRGKTKIIHRLEEIKDTETIRAILNAKNKEGITLITCAVINNFSKVEQLKEISQGNQTVLLAKVELLLVEEKYQQCLEILEKIYQQRKDLLGEGNLGTLDIRKSMADVIYKLQNYEKALMIYEDVYQRQQELLGLNNEHTLSTRSDMALVLYRQGKYHEALNIFELILQRQENLLTADHPHVLKTKNHMALVLNALQKFEDALKMNYEIFKIYTKKFGAFHPLTLTVKNNIALVLADKGEYDKAQNMYQQVYEERKKVLGPFHSDTMRTFHNKIAMLTGQKNYDEALKALEQLHNDQKLHLGVNHLDTLRTQQSIGMILLQQGKLYSGYKNFQQTRELKKVILGENHRETILIEEMMNSIRSMLQSSGFIAGDVDTFLQNLRNSMNSAALRGDLESVQNLLKSDVDVNARDSAGRTALHFATDGGNLHIINLILDSGADVFEITDKGNTALHTACAKGCTEIVDLLLQRVDDAKIQQFVNVPTKNGGTTALHVAAKNGYLPVVELLLKKGAIYDIRNKEGKEAIDLSDNENIIKILKIIGEIFDAVRYDALNIMHDKLNSLKKNEFQCVTNARNTQGFTLTTMLILNGKMAEGRNLLEKMKMNS